METVKDDFPKSEEITKVKWNSKVSFNHVNDVIKFCGEM